MKRSFALFITTVFFLWLIPLGVFIKPSQEKIACGGQRAICLCSHMKTDKASSKAMEAGVGLKAGNSAGKEKESSGGASHYFLTTHIPDQRALLSLRSIEESVFSRQNSFLKSIEHVPKA